jgi:DNA-binding winged helix-turn-helix (wHTH) protein/TolB-like protein/Tfp pilus assembly protein PilF
MDKGGKHIYEFEKFRLDEAKRLLIKGGDVVALMPKAFDILAFLVSRAGEVVEKDQLMSAVWPDTIVEENNLTQNISSLRRILGEKHRENRFIATVPGHGYKFVAKVREVDDAETPAFGHETALELEAGEPRFPTEPPISAVLDDEREFGRMPASPGNRPRRFWFAVLAAISLIGLSSMGLLYWKERTDATNSKVRSIAVLPFKPMSEAAHDQSLEMGMTDALISKLNSGNQITVRPLNAVRRFSSLEQDSVDAGRLLGVEAVLDGHIQSAGNRMRVSVRLTRVNDGKQIWADQFDEPSSDIFALQDSISRRVANALQITLGTRGAKRYTESVEAYQLYMKGDFHRSRLVLPEVQKSISYYEQAIAIDPTYAMAYVGLEGAYRAMVLTNDVRPTDVMPMARAASLKAIELDETLAEAHSAIAMVAFWYDWDWPDAEKHFLRALELDPNSAQTRFGYAHLLSNTGRHDQALAEIERARQLDPVSLVTNALEGQILSFAGRDDEALKILQLTAEMEPSFWLAHLFMTRIFLKKEMYPDAIVAATKARDITRGNAEATATIGYALAKSGKSDDARAILNELENKAATGYVASHALAQIYNGLGEKEKALDMLEKAFAEKDALMVFLKVEPKWDNLRAEPRFVELMRKMNFN